MPNPAKILGIAGLLLWGGLAQPARADWLLEIGTGPYWHQAEAANRTADQFLGRPIGSGGGQGAGGGGLDADVAGAGRLRLRHHGRAALAFRHRHALGPRLDLAAGVRLAYGRTRWFLPDGIDILHDPLRVTNTALSITPSLGIDRHFDAGAHGRLTLGAGVGMTALRSRMRFRSALLAVDRTEWFDDAFGYLRIELGHAALPRERLTLELQHRRSIGTHWRLGLTHRF